jgi:hypothetical protein
VRRTYPDEALVFDTETLPGPAQKLRVLVWRLYRDRAGDPAAPTCIEEGIAYPDGMATERPADFQLLQEYAAARRADVAPGFWPGLRCEPLSWWLERRLYLYGYGHRDRCTIVGFNLFFDLGRIAQYWAPATGNYRGGYSLGFWGALDRNGKWHDRKHRGRLRVRAIDPRRTMFRWAVRTRNDPDPERGPGRFVDLRTLAFALTDRPFTLEKACEAFGDPYTKAEVDYAEMTPELLDYAREDVRHTAALYRNCLAELDRHEGIALEPHRLYSPATVGARYLEAMGLRRPLVKFTGLTGHQFGWDQPGRPPSSISSDEARGNLDPEVLGWAMSAFYGGRAEARIVRTHVPVVLVDFTSMYPSVNALLGTWELLRAYRLKPIDVTTKVRELLSDPDLLDRCLTPLLWRQLSVTLVELEPDGDVLPVRARYDPAGHDYGIGVNPHHYDGRLWYALPDVVAAVLLSPLERGTVKHPRITRAVRLTPDGVQPDLAAVRLRGGRLIDPHRDDPFVAMIEERHRVKNDPDVDEEERARLDLFLKITANATAYGVLARFDRREQSKPTPVSVYGPDSEPLETSCSNPEDPGPFCFPPIAASITAAARLMLALLERIIRDAGGTYAFCDTDSMAIVASEKGGTLASPGSADADRICALSWSDVDRALARFELLNPYNRELIASVWKVELDSRTTPLWCYAISAKRYCLYRDDESGNTEVAAAVDTTENSGHDQQRETEDQLDDWSEHGLGLYLDPSSIDQDRPRRDHKGRRLWVAEAWRWILDDAHGLKPELPAWASSYALARFTVSNPRIERWFTGYNASQPPGEHIRPGSFGILAHPLPLAAALTAAPTAPYESDPTRWASLPWYDRRTGKPVRVTAPDTDDDPERRADRLARGEIPIQLLRDTLSQHRHHPELKSLAPDGGPAGRTSSGQLGRRPVRSSPAETELTGKEGNRLEERLTGAITDPSDYRTDYGKRVQSWTLVLTVLKELGAERVAALTRFSRSAVYAVLAGAQPRARNARTYEDAAVAHARERLRAAGLEAPDAPAATLALYLAHRESEAGRRCLQCGKRLPDDRRVDAKFCSDRCRTAAARA